MDMYRLVIDFPLGENQEKAITEAKVIVECVQKVMAKGYRSEAAIEVPVMQYRLQNDDDRTMKNYLDINENGHAARKKTVVEL